MKREASNDHPNLPYSSPIELWPGTIRVPIKVAVELLAIETEAARSVLE